METNTHFPAPEMVTESTVMACPTFTSFTGLNPAHYAGHEEWPNVKWAWEFLRRNPKFQAICIQIAKLPKVRLRLFKEKNAAATFGLKKYKHYSEDFSEGIQPKFMTASVSYWSRVSEKRYERLVLPSDLSKGEALVKFDITSMMKSTKSLDAQLDEARRRLEKSLCTYQKKIKQICEPTKHKAPLIELLRTLDAFSKWEAGLLGDVTLDQIASKIFITPTTDLERKIKRRHARALEYRNFDYCDLAATE